MPYAVEGRWSAIPRCPQCAARARNWIMIYPDDASKQKQWKATAIYIEKRLVKRFL